ncbi:IPTL-CTERM sorting domain-containing protein [Delftia acidovorans]|uniref:IPTL-CTERM sorting domain-containing protein n=2 Tax=Delftia acidovorans TaxID=80866 RepID=A0A7T2S620_DELAC|nr:IPTL-CTERM sorting domain-containing protein [Delftia acidovorans]
MHHKHGQLSFLMKHTTMPSSTHCRYARWSQPLLLLLGLGRATFMALLLALAAPAWAVSDNADLSDLTLSSGALLPSFNSGQLNYTAQVSNPTSTITITPTMADGTATVLVNGSPVANGASSGPLPLNVGPNTISVVVTAQDGVTVKTYTVTVTRASQLVTSTATTNIACNGSHTGIAAISPGGGTSPYTYAWSNLATTSMLTGLAAGVYSVRVTDSLGDYIDRSITVSQPTAITASAVHTDPSSVGGTNGTATVTPSGGTPGYTFSWSPSGATAATATGLRAGTHTVTITDANNCTYDKIVTLVDPAPTVQSVNVPANGAYSTGSVLSFTVNYSAAVTVVGVPSIPLTIGSTTRQATYASGSGSTALVFSYTVQAGDMDADGITLGSNIALNGGTLTGPAATNPSLVLNGVPSTALVLVPQQNASGQGVALTIANPAPGCTLTGPTTFANTSSLPLAQRLALPEAYSYPFAAVDFAADQCQPGSNLTVTLTYPSQVPQGATMMKWDGAAWQTFVPDSINNNQVTYTVADNGPLDTNKTSGLFADPAILAAPLVAPSAASKAIPTLSEWGLIFMSAILAMLGLARIRRRQL